MSLDKFYTSDEAARTFIDFIERYIDLSDYEHIIEPSAGSGSLLNHLPPHTVGIDLVPERDDIAQCDFFDFTYPEGKTITVGNPPFGKRSALAIDFFNKAALHSEAIAFIIPVTWEKYSIHRKLAEGWALIANERLPEKSFELDGKPYTVRCTMQLWIKSDVSTSARITSRPTGENPWFDFVKKDDCDFAIRQAYPKTVLKEDIDGQSHIYIKAKVPGVFEVFDSIQWQIDENRRMLGGASIPCLDKDTVLQFYLKYRPSLRITEAPAAPPCPDFSFVKKSEDPDLFVIGAAVHNIYPVSEWKPNNRGYFIKSHIDHNVLIQRFKSVDWKAMGRSSVSGGVFWLNKVDIINGYVGMYHKDLRKTEKEVGSHTDFSFVSKTDDWDFCMSSSPAIVRSKDYFNEKGGEFCRIFIKAHVPGLFETFNTIAWQSKEAKEVLGGSRFPVADTVDIVKVYSLFKKGRIPAKKGDWREQKERAKVRKKHTYRSDTDD